MNSPQSAPACNSGPGWRTLEPSRWAGSRYTAPSCSYTPPPSCPNSGPGWQMTSPPVWNGSSYSAPGCSYTPEPACPDGYEATQPASWNGSAWVGLSCKKVTPEPAKQFAGRSFNINLLDRGGWMPYFQVTGQADGMQISVHSQWNQSCKITGPGSICSFNDEGKVTGSFRAAAEAVLNDGGFTESNRECSAKTYVPNATIQMLDDGSLAIWTYRVSAAKQCYTSGSEQYWFARHAIIPVSSFPSITNGSNVTYGHIWNYWYL